jgi:hypothetical protein
LGGRLRDREVSVLPRFSNPWIALALKAVVGLGGAAAQGRGTDCQYARGIYVAPLRRPGVESPAASERREGLFDVEVDAEEQERPKDDGQQR